MSIPTGKGSVECRVSVANCRPTITLFAYLLTPFGNNIIDKDQARSHHPLGLFPPFLCICSSNCFESGISFSHQMPWVGRVSNNLLTTPVERHRNVLHVAAEFKHSKQNRALVDDYKTGVKCVCVSQF